MPSSCSEPPEDPEAFAVFYDRWEGPILAYFQRRVREPEVAVDLTGEVFASVLGAAGQFRGEHGDGSAAAWLFTIARNTLSTSLRRGRVEEEARRRLAAWEPVALVDVDLDAIAALGEDGPALARALARAAASASARPSGPACSRSSRTRRSPPAWTARSWWSARTSAAA